jgi:hypothetical protein
MQFVPQPVVVHVTEKGVYVDDKSKGTLVKKVAIHELSFATTDHRNKKLFSFICHQPKKNKMECFVFSVAKKAADFPKACNEAIRSQMTEAHRAEAEAAMIAAQTAIVPREDEDDLGAYIPPSPRPPSPS